MEGWKDGGVEGWRDGRMEGWKGGGVEGWKGGGMEGWKDGRMESRERIGGEPTQPSNLPFFQSPILPIFHSSLERAFACVSDSSTLGSAVPRSKSKST